MIIDPWIVILHLKLDVESSFAEIKNIDVKVDIVSPQGKEVAGVDTVNQRLVESGVAYWRFEGEFESEVPGICWHIVN